VRIIEALYRSAEKKRHVALAPFEKSRRPTERQEMRRRRSSSAQGSE
jgi:hypothetical protein